MRRRCACDEEMGGTVVRPTSTHRNQVLLAPEKRSCASACPLGSCYQLTCWPLRFVYSIRANSSDRADLTCVNSIMPVHLARVVDANCVSDWTAISGVVHLCLVRVSPTVLLDLFSEWDTQAQWRCVIKCSRKRAFQPREEYVLSGRLVDLSAPKCA